MSHSSHTSEVGTSLRRRPLRIRAPHPFVPFAAFATLCKALLSWSKLSFVERNLCLYLHGLACNCMQIHTLEIFSQKHVRRYRVRTGLCSAMKMNAQSANALEGRAPRARSRLLESLPLPASVISSSLKSVVRSPCNDVFSFVVYWHDLGTNLASEFISPPRHTGIMDTASMLFALNCTPHLNLGLGLSTLDSRRRLLGCSQLFRVSLRSFAAIQNSRPLVSQIGRASCRAGQEVWRP